MKKNQKGISNGDQEVGGCCFGFRTSNNTKRKKTGENKGSTKLKRESGISSRGSVNEVIECHHTRMKGGGDMCQDCLDKVATKEKLNECIIF